MSVTAKHKGKGLQALTANDLREGHNIWLAKDLTWSRHFTDALLSSDADIIEKMRQIGERDEEANDIVGVYFIDIEQDTAMPARYREKFRVHGPSYDTAQNLKKSTQ